MAGKEFLLMHNNAAKVVHQAMAQKLELRDNYCPYYKYQPESIIPKRNVKLFWDHPILIDHTVPYNMPDIIIIDNEEKIISIIEIGAASDDLIICSR